MVVTPCDVAIAPHEPVARIEVREAKAR